MASPVTALALIAAIILGSATAQYERDCCLETSSKHVPKHIASGYIIQEAGQGCRIAATIIITRRNRKLCLPHPDVKPSVADLIEYLDTKNKSHQ